MPATAKETFLGFLNIDKPKGITAHDVVARVRKILKMKQVGHGGTLDPMATGVLPIALGKATRLLRFLPGDKTYLAEITLGIATDTDDITGQVIQRAAVNSTADEVRNALVNFEGTQRQVPPLYSAVHIDGQRLYKLARAGTIPDAVPSREVTVHSIEFISYLSPVLAVRIACSAGTYIRSIARDLGAKLGCGGCLSGLAREKAGPFNLTSAISLEALAQQMENNQVLPLDPCLLLPLPKHEIDSTQRAQLLHGQSVAVPIPAHDKNDYVMAVHNDTLVAIARLYVEADQSFARIQPEVVIADARQPDS